jgi:hypothetical protein
MENPERSIGLNRGDPENPNCCSDDLKERHGELLVAVG